MEIKLEALADQRLRATLLNKSGQVRAILHSDLQPSRLELSDATGRMLEPFDERTRMKFDRTVRSSLFSRVAPDGELALENTMFRKTGTGVYELRWGPYTYREVRAGNWKARVVFEAKISTASDGKSVNDAWTGKVASNMVAVSLA